MSTPDVALIVTSYQRPGHVLRALRSIALQAGVAGRFEVVVTDDGSTDNTQQLIEQFARGADFPVRFTTHPHDGFRVSISRNEGVAASTAPYLLFTDGDCILPQDHLRIHLEQRREGVVRVGDCCRLDQATSERIDEAVIHSGEFVRWAPANEVRRLRRLSFKSRFYQWLRHPTKPRLIGNNVGMWRADYLRVNGYDENFKGWGCEDDDLGYRLRRAGVELRTILPWTHSYHLWHPVHASQPRTCARASTCPTCSSRAGSLAAAMAWSSVRTPSWPSAWSGDRPTRPKSSTSWACRCGLQVRPRIQKSKSWFCPAPDASAARPTATSWSRWKTDRTWRAGHRAPHRGRPAGFSPSRRAAAVSPGAAAPSAAGRGLRASVAQGHAPMSRVRRPGGPRASLGRRPAFRRSFARR